MEKLLPEIVKRQKERQNWTADTVKTNTEVRKKSEQAVFDAYAAVGLAIERRSAKRDR